VSRTAPSRAATRSPPFRIRHAPRPGAPPGKTWEGDEFVPPVRKILCNTYDYELQDEPIWAVDQGRPQLVSPRMAEPAHGWRTEQTPGLRRASLCEPVVRAASLPGRLQRKGARVEGRRETR